MSTVETNPNPVSRLQPIAGDPQLCNAILEMVQEAEGTALAASLDVGRPLTFRGTHGWHGILHGLAMLLIPLGWTWEPEPQPYLKAPAGLFPHGAHLAVIHGHWTGSWFDTNRRGEVTRKKIQQNAYQSSLFDLWDLPPVEAPPAANAPLNLYLISDLRPDGTLRVHLALVDALSHSGTRLYPAEMVTLEGGPVAAAPAAADLPQPQVVEVPIEELEVG